jgi:membrane dipeptidase
MILDVTHLSEKACFEALDRYQGAIAATHCNARALVPMERHLSDTQIRRLAERNAVIGIVLYNRFLKRGYELTDPRESVTLENVVAHIDHICQLLGNAEHLGLGSDFDGGFGAQHIPLELKSVLDVVNIAQALRERGYGEGEVSGIMGMNWLHFLRESWGDGAAG